MERIKKRKLILPFFIIFTMVFSVLSFSLFNTSSSSSSISEYKGHKFRSVNNVWVTNINGNEVVIFNDPNSLDIDIDGFTTKSINKLYLSRNPPGSITNELRGLGNLIPFSGIGLVDSCFEDIEGCEDFPLKSCADAISDVGVFEVKISENNKIERSGNCLKIEGDRVFIIKVIDRVILDALL